MKIKELLKMNIEDEVTLVIKAGEQDLKVAQKEISQYIVTHQIERHLEAFLENYSQPPTDKIGTWISGFFGSGKSYFAKILGYLLMNPTFHDEDRGIEVSARDLFNERLGNCKNPDFIKSAVRSLQKHPADTVMFEIIAEGSMSADTVQQVMFKMFLQMLGYSKDLTVAVMEYELDSFGYLNKIREAIQNEGVDYEDVRKNFGLFRHHIPKAMACTVGLSEDDARVFLTSAEEKYSKLAPADFAEHCVDYAKKTGRRVVFIVDEIGQYVTSMRDKQDRVLELQAIEEKFAEKGKGLVRLVVTAQEKLDQLIVDSTFDKNILDKLTDRFQLRLDLTSENVDEVARERLLKKKVETDKLFGDTYSANQGNINTITDTQGNYKKTDNKETFMVYYPFHHYHFELLPDIVQKAMGSTYYQATERKFIFLVDTILKTIKDEDFGRIVNAADLFDALGSGFFTSGVLNAVRSVDQSYTAKTVKASDVLKTLHLLKDLTSIAATENVITRMLCRSIHDRPYEIQDEVKDIVSFLENKKLVTRFNGQISLVTDLEKEFIEEMDKVVVRIPEVNAEIVERLQNLLTVKEVQYESGPSIPIEWIFSDSWRWGKKKGLSVNLSALENVDYSDVETKSMIDIESVYLVPNQKSRVYDLSREIKTIEAALNIFRTKKSSVEPRNILIKYSKQMEDRRSELSRELQTALDTGKVIYDGSSKDVVKAVDDLKKLFKDEAIRRNYSEITVTTASISDIQRVLTVPQDRLHSVRSDNDHKVFDQAGELIETHKIIDPIITFLSTDRTGADMLDKFSAPPYGWSQETILYAVACLMRGGKITIDNIDSYNKPEVLKVLKSISEFKNARIRKSVVLSPSDRQQLMQIVNPLLTESKLSLQSPRSEFINQCREATVNLHNKLKNLKQTMENLGASISWDLKSIWSLIKDLEGESAGCLDNVIKARYQIEEFKNTAKATESFLKQNEQLIENQKGFIEELEGEILKSVFDTKEKEELKQLIDEYNQTLPSISSFGGELNSTFERLINTYKGYFKKIHEERDKSLREVAEFLKTVEDRVNEAGKKASDQDWFKMPNDPCENLSLSFSVKCENCHSGYAEASYVADAMKSKLSEFKQAYEAFKREKLGPTRPDPDSLKKPEIIELKRRMTYAELKKKVTQDISFSDDQEIELKFEE